MTAPQGQPGMSAARSTARADTELEASGVATRAPVVLTVAEAAQVLKISRWSIYQLIRARRLSTVTIGRRRLVPVAALIELLGRLTEEAA
ncbi:helix-turn-helix domain-containing protein [Pseudofrankia sp. BMG5.36]|uniref:helix-turn-helix domain-containing protein n=1 Tax=Pseudofrankia sp. BMG5.36 TaxID=1834512 RepID=UPI001F518205|nr:helix-turn-helix domain-containing protein [Pseudofrankia sp. BMG5.36]